jgi:amino acid permease
MTNQKCFSFKMSDSEICDIDGDLEVKAAPHLEGGDCSILDVSFNLVNTTVGAGIIGLPFALGEAGFGFGILLAVTVAYLVNISMIMMVDAGVRVDRLSFPGVAQSAFGRSGFWIVNLAVFINGLGVVISYLIIIGSLIPVLADQYLHNVAFLRQRELVMTLTSILFIFPLLLWRTVGKLSKVSVVGVLCIPVIISCVTYRALINPVGERPHVEFPFMGKHVFPAIGVMAFSFVCNQTAFMNYVSLKNRNIKRWSIATTIAFTASLIISLGLAIIGYVAFGANVESNLLMAFPKDDHVINFARFTLAISMFLTYPMQFYPIRTALLRICGLETLNKLSTDRQHLLMTILLFSVSLGIGLAVKDLGVVYELVGGLCGTMIAYLIPAASALVIYCNWRKHSVWNIGDDNQDETATLLGKSDRPPTSYFVLAVILIIFGTVAMFAGTIMTIWKTLS